MSQKMSNDKLIEILEKIKSKILILKTHLMTLNSEKLKAEIDILLEFIEDLKDIEQIVADLEKEFSDTMKKYELNLIFTIRCTILGKDLFNTDKEMKRFLEENIPSNILRDGLIFNRPLKEKHGYFIRLCERNYHGSSVIIDNRGIVIFCLHFNPYERETQQTEKDYYLPLFEITYDFLTFLSYIDLIFKEIEYKEDIEISLRINGLEKWYYGYGTPLKRKYFVSESLRDIKGIYNRERIIEDHKNILRKIIGSILTYYDHPKDDIFRTYEKLQKNGYYP